ncbi:MAG: heavy metal translocating P-type ATPase [Halodesulfurarchaeum sp.]
MAEDYADGEDDHRETESVSARLTVPDMDCPSCAKKVDSALERVEGVVEVDLRPTTGIATVRYDPGVATERQIVDAIEAAGYDVMNTPAESEEADQAVAPATAIWTSSRAIKTWIGAVALVLGLAFEFVFVSANPTIGQLFGVPLTLADASFLGAIAASGAPVVREGWYSARNRSLDIDLLMSTAILAATGIGYFVEAATLAVLFSIAELLEDYSMDRARNSLRELMELTPDEATQVTEEGTETVPVSVVSTGDRVAIRPGEKIPVDGTVLEGRSAVDQSPITGESVPANKAPGSEVYAGTINKEGYLEVEVTSNPEDTTLAQIIDLVQGAEAKKTDAERFVDRFAGYYTPVIVVLAILTAAIPPLFFEANWQTWFIRGLTLLVIACPCAFVISTPVSVVSAITSAARNGVLIKGGDHLERMGEVDAIALDKTGTLTRGELAVTDVIPVSGRDERDLLYIAGGLEARSDHPIAASIHDRAMKTTDGELPSVTDFESVTGRGVRGTIDGTTYYAGNPSFFESLGVDLNHAHLATDGGVAVPISECEREDCLDLESETITNLQEAGKTVVVVGTESAVLGVVGIADSVRPQAPETVERLREIGIAPIVMLTGDNEGTARAIAESVGVDEYRSELLPAEKVAAVESLQARHGTVAMVGDGVNDAPALAAADVGIAMGAAGSDTALETADIALMSDAIEKLPYLSTLSRRANEVIKENIYSSLGVKALLALGVPLGYVSVALAVVVGDMGMSLGVTGNAMRLSRLKP